MANPNTVLIVLLIGGLMGILGQGARAVAGLKSMADEAKSLSVNPSDLFQAARLIVSLIIGLLIGLAAAAIFLSTADAEPKLTWNTLIGFAAAGYTGVDFIEAFISKYLGTPPAATSALAARNAAFTLQVANVQATAHSFVYQVLADLRPGNPIADDTELAALAYDDGPSKDVLRWEINRRHWHGVALAFGALNACSKVSDVVDVVKKAEGVVA